MRNLIQIVENQASFEVYHGGPSSVVFPRMPFYVSPVMDMAESYGPVISTFIFTDTGRGAPEQIARDEADIMGIDHAYKEPMHVLLKNITLVQKLAEEYEFVEFDDSPADGTHDGVHYPAYCVLRNDARCLRRA